MKSGSIRFTQKQIEYLMIALGVEDPNEAIDIFAQLMKIEGADPIYMPLYLTKIMKKDPDSGGEE